MKKPHEILFQRHRAADPKLDAIQRAVVGQLNIPRRQPLLSSLRCFPRNYWREVIWPARRIWGALAAAWMLMLMVNLDFRAQAPQTAAVASSNAGGFLMALHDQELWMIEFTDRQAPRKASPPRPLIPQPGAKLRAQFFTV